MSEDTTLPPNTAQDTATPTDAAPTPPDAPRPTPERSERTGAAPTPAEAPREAAPEAQDAAPASPAPRRSGAKGPRKRAPRATPQEKQTLATLQGELKQLQETGTAFAQYKTDDFAEGCMARARQRSLADEQQRQHLEIAAVRRGFIQAVQHATRRAYKELPHFFKFRLFKTTPRRFLVKGKLREFIEPVKEIIDFRGIKAEVTYYEGELGDQDRMVYLAIINEAIRHKEYVREFGKIPFSMNELADKAGFSKSHQREEWVEDCLNRLMRTGVNFKNSFGDFKFKGGFNLIEFHFTIEKVKVTSEVQARLLTPHEQALSDQAQALLDKFKPRTPKLTMVRFNEPLMEAILGNQITTVDMWALQRISGNPARALYLYLWDISQWRTSKEPLEMLLTELLTLMDLALVSEQKDEKDYIYWKRAKDRAEAALQEVNQVAQFIDWHEWEGEKEHTRVKIQLSNVILQIPPR